MNLLKISVNALTLAFTFSSSSFFFTHGWCALDTKVVVWQVAHSLTDPHTHRSDLVAPKKEREGEEEEEKCGFNMFSNAPVMAAFWVTLP
jgi:hypothetical protein